MERLTVPDERIDGGLRRAIIDVREVRKEAMTIYWRLKKYEDTGLAPEEILEGKLLTGWIPVEERLPKEPELGLVDMDSLEEYIVTITDATKPTVLFYAGDGEWYREGTFYSVNAWMPLPEPYRPEQREE